MSQRLLGAVLQGPLHQRRPFGQPACLTSLIPRLEGEAGSLVAPADEDDVAHERQGGSLRPERDRPPSPVVSRIAAGKPAVLEDPA